MVHVFDYSPRDIFCRSTIFSETLKQDYSYVSMYQSVPAPSKESLTQLHCIALEALSQEDTQRSASRTSPR